MVGVWGGTISAAVGHDGIYRLTTESSAQRCHIQRHSRQRESRAVPLLNVGVLIIKNEPRLQAAQLLLSELEFMSNHPADDESDEGGAAV